MARGNRQTTRTRIHISPPRSPEKDNRRLQILIYWNCPLFDQIHSKLEAGERQAVRAATAAGASVLLPEADARQLAEGWQRTELSPLI